MARPRNRLGLWCKTTITLSFIAFMRLLPLPVARRLGRVGGHIAYYVVPRVRTIGMKNINLAYGDTLTLQEKKSILKKSMINLALIGAELPHQAILSSDRRDPMCAFKGREHIEKSGTGIMLGAHLSNWEWAFGIFCGEGYKATGIVRPLRDPRLNQAINDLRTSSGTTTIEKRAAATQAIKALRAGINVGILGDQSTRKNGLPTTFFSQPCWSTIGPAMLALRAKVPIYPMSLVRDDTGFYTLEILPPIFPERQGAFADDLMRITQQCQNIIEEMIRAHPEQWMWLHDRWKKQPDREKEWAERQKKSSLGNEADTKE